MTGAEKAAMELQRLPRVAMRHLSALRIVGLATALVLVLMAAGRGRPQTLALPAAHAQAANAQPRWETVASGLEVPWALAFAPDGRLFVTERPGRVRVIHKGRLRPEPWATLGVEATGEAGLMGIALAPDFARSGHVFVVGTFQRGSQLVNRVLRLTDRDGRGRDTKVIVDKIPAATQHAGDALAFGPDGMLYVATGDVRQPRLAQDRRSLAGKILRYRADGTVPPDNPFPGSPVYALGLRNPQGLAWSAGGELFATDHGPSGFRNEAKRRHRDELNVIRRGANYGWPVVAGASQDKRFLPPLAAWTPAIAPSGLAFHRGQIFVAALRGQQLRRVTLRRAPGSRTGWRVDGQQALLHRQLHRLRAVATGPNGALYFTTSNRDQLSSKRLPGDDRVLRLVTR